MRYWFYGAGQCFYNGDGESYYTDRGWRLVDAVYSLKSDVYVPDTLLLMKGIPLK